MKKCCVRGARRIACQELPHFVLEVQIDGVGVPTEDSSLMDCLRSGYCKNIHSINSRHFQKTGMPLCLVFFPLEALLAHRIVSMNMYEFLNVPLPVSSSLSCSGCNFTSLYAYALKVESEADAQLLFHLSF